MNAALRFRIILENPPIGVDFGLQEGSGERYQTIQKQRSTSSNLEFEFSVTVKINKKSFIDFYGPFVQGTPGERFIYIGIGTYAGQADSEWSRRLKVPLKDISDEKINQLISDQTLTLQTNVPGTGKDGTPNCATVKPFNGWHLITSGP